MKNCALHSKLLLLAFVVGWMAFPLAAQETVMKTHWSGGSAGFFHRNADRVLSSMHVLGMMANAQAGQSLKSGVGPFPSRFWFYEVYNGQFVGGYWQSGPLVRDDTGFPQGWTVGGGFIYGYHLLLGKGWGMEFAIGLGQLYTDYKRYIVEEETALQKRDECLVFAECPPL